MSLAVVPVDGRDAVQIESVKQDGIQEVAQAQTPHIDSTIPIVSASANPSSLWPPNHKFVPVTVKGHVFDASGGVPRAVSYHVIDEYGQVQPSGTARVQAKRQLFVRRPASVEPPGARQGRSALHDCRLGDHRAGRPARRRRSSLCRTTKGATEETVTVAATATTGTVMATTGMVMATTGTDTAERTIHLGEQRGIVDQVLADAASAPVTPKLKESGCMRTDYSKFQGDWKRR